MKTTSKQKIIPNLWFDHEAQEAVNFYTTLFEDAVVLRTNRYTEAGKEFHQQEPGSIMTVEFSLNGFKMVALNGGPTFKLNPSISLFLLCQDEEEIQKKWRYLSEGGEVRMPLEKYDWSPKYGWVQDRFGLNWQLMLEEQPTDTPSIVPMLFFTGANQGMAEAAIEYYIKIFKNTGIEGILKYGSENPYTEGKVMHAQFKLEGQTFMAMDSGVENDFPFNEGFSFIVECENQQEIDHYWEQLTHGGDAEAQQCGWLKDKFGVSWQIVPKGMGDLMDSADPERAGKAMNQLLQMKKIDCSILFENQESTL